VALETSPIARVRQMTSLTRAWFSTRYEDQIEPSYLTSMEKLFEYRKAVVKSAKGISLAISSNGRLLHL
jgi:hypothetical protein